MQPERVSDAADILMEARRTGRGIKELPAPCKPATAAEANQIVDEVTRRLGEEIGGWKITFLYKPREKPFRAPVFASRVFKSPANIPVAIAPSRFIEPEIMFRLTRDLPPRAKLYHAQEVAEALEACPSFEIIATRFDTSAGRSLRDMLNQRLTMVEAYADHITNGAFVIGEPVANWCDVDFAKMRVVMKADDKVIVDTIGGHAFTDPFLALVVLANELRSGPGLKAGQVLATGSFSGYFPVEAGQVVTAEFEHIGRVQATFVD
jgi:2-keto-4-pentenoate hydratase